jgi:AcrR family transcriptional regulator
VAANQRWRLLAAAGEVLAERGYARTTSAAIADRARVSRSTFYAQFEDVEDCLVAAHQMAVECVLELATTSCPGEDGGRDPTAPADEGHAVALPAAVEGILEFLTREPAFAKLLGAEVAAGVPAIAAARDRLTATLAGMAPGEIRPTLIGGAVALVAERIDAGDPARLRELGPQLSQLLTMATTTRRSARSQQRPVSRGGRSTATSPRRKSASSIPTK